MLLIQILLFIILALCVANVTDVQHLKLVKEYRNHWKSQAIHYKLRVIELERANVLLNGSTEKRLKKIKDLEISGNPIEDYVKEKHSQDRCMGFIDGYHYPKVDSQTR